MNIEIKEDESDYVCFKKLLLFGEKSTGKSSFSSILKRRKFQEDIAHTEDCRQLLFKNIF